MLNKIDTFIFSILIVNSYQVICYFIGQSKIYVKSSDCKINICILN